MDLVTKHPEAEFHCFWIVTAPSAFIYQQHHEKALKQKYFCVRLFLYGSMIDIVPPYRRLLWVLL